MELRVQGSSSAGNNYVICNDSEAPEEWRDIAGYNGLYQVSSHGRLKSFWKDKNGRILSASDKNGWYLSSTLVGIDGSRKTARIHLLVAGAFIPKPCGKTQINHKDLNKQNNRVDNLEWVTPRENMRHVADMNPSFLTGMKVRNRFIRPRNIQQFDFDGNFISEYANSVIASKMSGVCQRNILQVARQDEYKPGMTRKQAGGYVWKLK